MTITFNPTSIGNLSTERGQREALKRLTERTEVLKTTVNGIVGGGGGGSAPVDASYLVGAANGTLTSERVVTDTATVEWDLATAAQAKAQVPDGAITYAKIQDISATDKLLGRSTAGAGDVEEIACTAAGRALIDDANVAAQRTTLGLGSAALQASSAFAAASHSHAEADVTGLTADLAAKAPLASPAFTGVPTVPTAGVGTNSTQAASTAFVAAAVSVASAAVTSPATLTDLVDLAAWYSADNPNNTIPSANDGLITIFADKSGNGRDFTPGSGSIIKQYAQLAGLPVAFFASGMTGNSQKTLALKGALTFFAVLKITSTAAYQNIFAPGVAPADPADLHLYWDQPTNKWQIDGRTTPTANVAGRWMTLVAHYYNVSTTMNMKLRENGAQVQAQVASTIAAHPVPGTSGVPVNYDVRMFYNGGFAFTSQIAEWGFYAATRDGTEATLEKYLRAKYSTW